uniref:Pallidin n=1 Tax=Zeugodacus cucurbitae TaxID=28588 RepID=A0A0A1X151_ZEUCU
MLKSSNFESIISAVEAEGQQPNNNSADLQQVPTTLPNSNANCGVETQLYNNTFTSPSNCKNNNNVDYNDMRTTETTAEMPDSLATKQLASGILQIFEPPLVKARGQLKELIGKQNKIYIDLSAEKFKLDNAETAKLHEMMNNVKIYREKLVKIKKQMQSIYQRTKVLKKRALNVQACKQKELQRKLQKQQQEEALIAKQQQQTQATTPRQ